LKKEKRRLILTGRRERGGRRRSAKGKQSSIYPGKKKGGYDSQYGKGKKRKEEKGRFVFRVRREGGEIYPKVAILKLALCSS